MPRGPTPQDYDATSSIEHAWSLPAGWYLAPEIAAHEARAVFRPSWILACAAADVALPGSYFAGEHCGLPWVVVRDESGALRAFANVCRHKASLIADGAGRAGRLTCPYHGWTYRLDGALASAPRSAGMCGGKALDMSQLALPPLAVEVWGPLVLVNADLAAAPFDSSDELRELAGRFAATGWDQLTYAGRKSWDVACNWKVFCDNYLDGGYHVASVHPSLAGQLDLESYRTECRERWSLQSSAANDGDAEARARIGPGALYAWVWPNLMLNRYGPVLDTNVVVPLGPERCRVVFDFWFDHGGLGDVDGFIARSMAQSELTQLEDVAICERVQRGVASGTWQHGPLAPRVEAAIHHFHKLVAAALTP